ncbi:ANE_G0034010.mRNA.1.CDS.1 [Saccharomyces cerevisiae]|nr:ANE_G0034010.mRNA.1.CDS.1 [Saccharomyces cerevisiae]CAI6782152.1 ANE_G0034010.mRNA.1.CDS.1 [Saccharomyces cerevisiae]
MVGERSRPLVISILSCAFAVAAIVGPIIGGAFTTHVTWRWCFSINLPIGGLAIIMFYSPIRQRIRVYFNKLKML